MPTIGATTLMQSWTDCSVYNLQNTFKEEEGKIHPLGEALPKMHLSPCCYSTLTCQMDCFLNAFRFISHIHLVKSPFKVFVKGRKSLEGDWVKPLSITFKRIIRFSLERSLVRLPIGVRGDMSCTCNV